MSKVKASGKVAQQSQSKRHGKRLGVKIFGGQSIKTGQIIIRQRGSKYHAGTGVGMGRDHTLFAMMNGVVKFGRHWGKTVAKVVSA